MRISENDLSEFSMLDLFRMELETQVEKLNQGLLDIEHGNAGVDVLESLMRAAHSIKGAARMVNVEPVVKVAHEVEDCFVALQHQEIELDKQAVDNLLASVDLIAQVGKLNDGQIKNWEADHQPEIDNIVQTLSKVHNGAGREKETLNEKYSETLKADYSKENNSNVSVVEEASSLTIRIPVDRLDRILDLAGKSLVQTHELNAVMPDLWQIKHKQKIIISQLNRLQEHLSENNASEALKDHVKSILGEENKLRLQYADGIAKLDTIDRRSSTIADYLHREIISSRMRPISEILNGLPRMVRDFSHRLNKNVRLQMSGLYTLVDRHVLEHIDTPIKHIVQNAIDHGIELPEDRIIAQKNPLAILTISVSMSAGMLLIELKDDGAGVNFEKLKSTILKKGIASQTEIDNLSQTELLDYLFYPGFSTKQHVTEISGRGVGLDLVKDVVVRLNGTVQVSSVENQGVCFQLCLPLTISVIRVFLTTICGESYAFPTSAVKDVQQIKLSQLAKVNDRYYISTSSGSALLVHANEIFAGNLPKTMPEQLSVIFLNGGEKTYCVVVDKTHGEQELSIQNLSPDLGKIKGISSAAILSSGALTLIIDIDDYIRSIDMMVNSNQALRLFRDEVLDMCEVLNVLVVDDSLTVRETQRKILVDGHYRVSVAEDGVEALKKIQESSFDILVTDVDMPNMDGLRLINEVRYLADYADMPILVVSNREKSFVKQSIILDEKTMYYPKGQFSATEFLSFIQRLSKLVANIDVI